jgi:hypothetical protein
LTQVEHGELRNLSDQDLFVIGPAKLRAALKLSWEDNEQVGQTDASLTALTTTLDDRLYRISPPPRKRVERQA